MKAISEILTVMYDVLNVDQVTDLLTDGLFRVNRLETSKGSCIVINPLAFTNDFVSEGVLNVNIFVPNLSDNTVDEAAFAEITEAVIDAIEAYSNPDNYMIFEISGQNLIADIREESFVNLRVNFFCEQ